MDRPLPTDPNLNNQSIDLGPLVLLFCLGILAGLMEVSWLRVITLWLQSSAHAFAAAVAGFFLGFALTSSLIGGRSVRDLGRWFSQLPVVAGVGLCLLLLVSPWVGELFSNLRLELSGYPRAFMAFEIAVLGVVTLAAFLPAAVLGAAFPAVVNGASGYKRGALAAAVIAAESSGFLLGLLTSGLFLLPNWNLSGVAITALVFACIPTVLWLRQVGNSSPKFFAPMTLAILIGMVSLSALKESESRLALGPRSSLTSANVNVAFLQHDLAHTVAVGKIESSDQVYQPSMVINGARQNNDDTSSQSDYMLAHIPLTLFPKSERVAVVGLGGGATARAALEHPIQELKIFELSSAVVASQEFVRPGNSVFRTDPRVSVEIGDALQRLRECRSAQKKYDVFLSHGYQMWFGGSSQLFSQEFYRLVSECMSSRGVFGFWLPQIGLTDEILQTLIPTLRTIFPFITVWTPMGNTALFLTSRENVWEDFKSSSIESMLTPGMNALGVTQLTTILSLQSHSPGFLESYGAEAKNTLLYPKIEYLVQGIQYSSDLDRPLRIGDERRKSRVGKLLLSQYLTGDQKLTKIQSQEIRQYYASTGHSGVTEFLGPYLEKSDPLLLNDKILEAIRLNEFDKVVDLIEQMDPMDRDQSVHITMLSTSALAALNREDKKGAIVRLNKLRKLIDAYPKSRLRAMHRAAGIEAQLGLESAVESRARVLDLAKLWKQSSDIDRLKQVVEVYIASDRTQAIEVLGRMLELNPEDPWARNLKKSLENS